jgi:hypothetical protein
MATYIYQDAPEIVYLRKEGIFEFEIVEGKDELAGGDSKLTLTFATSDGERINDNFTLNAKFGWRFEKFLKKLGMAGFSKGQEIEFEADQFIGLKIKGRVERETWRKDGETKDRESFKIREYYALGEKTTSSASTTKSASGTAVRLQRPVQQPVEVKDGEPQY